ncbi:MAG: oligosaccharide flippase family protein [Bacteroidales bacterium]|nr:oligosaccharide flippase family protein [Bacteroidales bacterium]MCF8337150.1 oligosaccharide flippase family protein [Bacteroidales bacterium]
MLNNIKLATKDTLIYSLGNISTKIIGLILLPIYTKELTVAEYGVLGTVEITIQVLIAIFSFSLQRALSRWYWDKRYRDKQKSIFFTTLVFIAIGILLMLVLLIPFSGSFSQSLLDSGKYTYLFQLLLVSAAFQILSRLILIVVRLQRKALLFSISNIFKLVITLGLTIYFVVGLQRGVEGIIEAQIIGFISLILFNIKFILKNISPVFERIILKEMLLFSYPLAISGVGGVLLTVTDKYAVRFVGGMEDMGLYNLGFKVGNVLKLLFINSVFNAIGPMRYKMMDQPNNKRFYSKLMTYTSFGFVILLLGLSLFSKEAIRVLASNKEYWGAYQIVPILVFAQLFELLRRNANFGLIVEKKTKIISMVMIFVMVLNIGLNIGFIYFFGPIGAAIALLISQAIYFGLIYTYSQRHYFIPYEIRKVFIMILLSAVIVGISYLFLNSMDIIPRIIIKLLLIAIFPVLLYFFKFYDPVEIDRLKGAWNKWRKPKKWRENLKNIKIK